MSLKDAIYPLDNLQQFFSLFYLIQESDDDHCFISESFNDIFGTNYSADSISLFLAKFLNLFRMDKAGLVQLFASLKKKASNKKEYLLPPVNKCIDCHFILQSSNISKKIVAYCFDSPKILFFKVKRCERCDIDYSFRNYKRCSNSETFLYPEFVPLTFLATSQDTCFEIKLLRYLDEQIIRNGVTFEGFSDSYNQLYPKVVGERPLNRIRLSEAWYSYKIKHYLFLNKPNDTFLDFKSAYTETFLEPYIELWKDEFTFRWSQIHKTNCTVLNCDATGSFIFY